MALPIIPDRISATLVVHFAHEYTNTYLAHIEVELYGTFFYKNQFSGGNTILFKSQIDPLAWNRSPFVGWLGL